MMKFTCIYFHSNQFKCKFVHRVHKLNCIIMYADNVKYCIDSNTGHGYETIQQSPRHTVQFIVNI